MTAPDRADYADLDPDPWEMQQLEEAIAEAADEDFGPWRDDAGSIAGLDDAFARMDQASALNGQRIGLDIVAQLDRRPSAEDRVARALDRIADGTYMPAPQPGYDPGGRADACGPLDDFGRCGAAFHVKGCHQTVEASAATGDADAAHAWRETMFGYTLSPEILGYELASPGDGDDWQADALLTPLGGQEAAIREQVLAYLGEPRGAAPQPTLRAQRRPDVSGLRTALGL